jgi:hypothetical protein
LKEDTSYNKLCGLTRARFFVEKAAKSTGLPPESGHF